MHSDLTSLLQRIRVWMAPFLQEEFWRSSSGGRLQSCVRPFSAALRPLALMEVRRWGPPRSLGFENPGYRSGCSQHLGTAAHSITPRPLASVSFRASLAYAADTAARRQESPVLVKAQAMLTCQCVHLGNDI